MWIVEDEAVGAEQACGERAQSEAWSVGHWPRKRSVSIIDIASDSSILEIGGEDDVADEDGMDLGCRCGRDRN